MRANREGGADGSVPRAIHADRRDEPVSLRISWRPDAAMPMHAAPGWPLRIAAIGTIAGSHRSVCGRQCPARSRSRAAYCSGGIRIDPGASDGCPRPANDARRPAELAAAGNRPAASRRPRRRRPALARAGPSEARDDCSRIRSPVAGLANDRRSRIDPIPLPPSTSPRRFSSEAKPERGTFVHRQRL